MQQTKVAVVTGGSRGIGKAVVLRFAQLGMKVVVNYSRNSSHCVALEKELKALNASYLLFKQDVSDYRGAQELIQTAKEHFGRIDILVNNAGIVRDNLLLRMSEEEFDQVLQVNLKGAFNCLKHVSKIMLKQRSGVVINMASVVGIIGNAGQVNYAASKAGLIGMTKSAAKELAGRGIRVNAVAPGYIETAMTANLSEAVRMKMFEQIPLRRFGQPEDVADVVAFLVSEQARYMTGQVLHVDGGMVM